VNWTVALNGFRLISVDDSLELSSVCEHHLVIRAADVPKQLSCMWLVGVNCDA